MSNDEYQIREYWKDENNLSKFTDKEKNKISELLNIWSNVVNANHEIVKKNFTKPNDLKD